MAEAGVETERMWIGNKPVRGCIACEKCENTGCCAFTDDLANEIIERLLAADGLVVGTPVYFAEANGALLALLAACSMLQACTGGNSPASRHVQ